MTDIRNDYSQLLVNNAYLQLLKEIPIFDLYQKLTKITITGDDKSINDLRLALNKMMVIAHFELIEKLKHFDTNIYDLIANLNHQNFEQHIILCSKEITLK